MVEYSCSHCGFPIEDDECYRLSDRAGNPTGWIHVECHEGYKTQLSKGKIDKTFTICYNEIYDTTEVSAANAIQSKWRSESNERYNADKLKMHKAQFESNGPNGIMLNDLTRNFTNHPNAVRIMIRTMFRHPSYKKKAIQGVMENKESPLLFDLLLLESIICIYDNEPLIADKMLSMLYDINNSQGVKAISSLLKNSILVPSNIFRTSVLMKIIRHHDFKEAFEMCLELPPALILDSSHLFNRVDDIELSSSNHLIHKMIQRYKDRPVNWLGICHDLFGRESVRNNRALVNQVKEISSSMIASGDLEMDIVRYSERDWSKRIVWLIETLGLPEYNLKQDLMVVKQMSLSLGIWNEACSHAMFRISEPAVYQALKSDETIFDV